MTRTMYAIPIALTATEIVATRGALLAVYDRQMGDVNPAVASTLNKLKLATERINCMPDVVCHAEMPAEDIGQPFLVEVQA